MLEKKSYSNGQNIYEVKDNVLTYYYKDGKIKASGNYINGLMEGEWRFYWQEGLVWQVGYFKQSKKHGVWIRFDKNGEITYNQTFENGKQVKLS